MRRDALAPPSGPLSSLTVARLGVLDAGLVGEVSEFASHLEVDGLLGLNRDFVAGLWVAADVGTMLVEGEGAEAPDLDSVPLREGVAHGGEDALHDLLGPLLRDSGAFGK